ncbi:hypothetical protein XA68_14997 [Ophiocordyceps unilateralis]|uniref:Uncharacterized protein n=1 Tax=Ophiocordyceps unilateralis TaxID=268505 RepID=A0A2A9P9G9_OPHUN|nr:hypothetical protein XA68_14997 [Ophiocordyceps unilateralis]
MMIISREGPAKRPDCVRCVVPQVKMNFVQYSRAHHTRSSSTHLPQHLTSRGTHPSEYEKNYYYFGLPSQPRLVARSSTTVWVPPRDERGMLNKRLRHVGVHTIIDAWNNDSAFLRTEIIRTLVDEGADFHAIDLLRSGYEESQSPSPETGVTTPTGDPRNAPVVLLVSVAPQSLSWPAGRRLAVRCWTVLRRHQFEDVHCEIKESRLQSLAIAPLLPLTNERTSGLYWRHLRHLSESVGTSIAAADEPFRQGALGLYLRDNHSDDVYALTCRHVCFGPEQGGEILPGFPASLSMSKEVVQPGSTTYEELAESLQTLSRDYHLQLDRMEKSQCIMDEDRRLRLMKHHEHHAALVDSALSKFSIREEVQSRVIGEVAYVRDFALGDHDHLSDWCLIRADPSRFSTPLINLQNRLPIGSSSLDSALQLAQNRFPLVKLGDDFTLTLEATPSRL